MASEMQEDQFSQANKIAAICIVLQLSVTALLLFINQSSLYVNDNITTILKYSNLFLTLGLIILYFYAYKFYSDNFYLLVFVGWLSLFISNFFKGFFSLKDDTTFRTSIFLLSFIPAIIFYIASQIPTKQRPNYRRIKAVIFFWLIYVLITYILLSQSSIYFVSLWSINFVLDKPYILDIAILPLDTWALFRVGTQLRSRLDPKIHGIWSSIAPMTFYWYAIVQPIIIFRYISYVYLPLFLLALYAKILNGVSIMNIINRDSLLREKQMQRRSALEDIGALAASIEHDVRNPLGIIEAELYRMEKKYQDRPDIISGLNRIGDQTSRIYASTQIIPVLRGDANLKEQLVQKIDPIELLHKSWRDLKVEVDISHIRFTTPSQQKVFAKGYGPLLQQAMVNIIKNSIEAIREAGRQAGVIQVELKPDVTADGLIRIDISDNGCGISEEQVSQVTSLYTTKGNRTTNSGIGLFITNKIINTHAGKLEIQSKRGEGTTVSVFLPKWNTETEG